MSKYFVVESFDEIEEGGYDNRVVGVFSSESEALAFVLEQEKPSLHSVTEWSGAVPGERVEWYDGYGWLTRAEHQAIVEREEANRVAALSWTHYEPGDTFKGTLVVKPFRYYYEPSPNGDIEWAIDGNNKTIIKAKSGYWYGRARLRVDGFII